MDPAWLADLGHLLERKYHDTGKFQDLCNASALFSAAVSNTTENDPSYSHYHDSMMSNLQVAFDMQLEQEDIVERVMMCRQLYEAHEAVKSLEAIQAMSEAAMGDEDFSCGSAGASDDDVGADDQTEKIPRWAVLQFMSLFYYKEYKKKEGIEDSDSDDSETSNSDSEPENQSEQSDPEESDPEESDPGESDPGESDPEKSGHIEFLDKAIHASQEAIREYREETQTTIDGLPAIVAMSTALARMLERRYDNTGQEEDLNEAIQLCRRASQNTPSDDIHFATVLEYLRMKLARRYKRTWQIEDIDELICLRRQTMKVIPDNDHKLLSDLGNLLEMRYDQTGQNEDLNEAIRLSRQAIMITPRDEPGFAGVLATFGGQLIRLYRRSGLEEDLEESIQISRQAIQIMSSDDVDLEKPLNNLGIALGQRYERTGKMEDLDEAIEVLIKAVQLTSTGHINQTGLFINLGNSLERRYGQIGRIEDLNQATGIFLRAVELLPENDPDLAGVLNGLGNKLFRGYLRQNIPEILDYAIRVCRQGIQLTTDNYHNKIMQSRNLAMMLHSRYELTGQTEDLEKALQISRHGVQAIQTDHPDHPMLLYTLGTTLASRYQKSGDIRDLEEAILMSGKAIQSLPNGHPHLIWFLCQHPNLLRCQYKETKRVELLDEAIRLMQQVFQTTSASPIMRANVATQLVELLLERGDHQSGYILSTKAIDLLQIIHSRSLALDDRRWIVTHFLGLATLGCSFSLQVKQPLINGLQLLESGRGVILSLLMDDRSDTTKLKEANPDLCSLYETLRLQVNTPFEGPITNHENEWKYTKQPKAIDDLEKCIQDIQRLPGFESFQLGLTKEQIQHASIEGSIIVINMSQLRSDAIIVSSTGLDSVSLPRFNATEAQTWAMQNMIWASPSERGRKNKEYRKFLAWLWHECVKPILSHLGHGVQSSPESLPRVWWIGTGIASFFPFHAASDFSAGSTEHTFCRVLSSYTVSIKALIHARERTPISSFSSAHPRKMLMVTMGTTPGADDLPGTETERSTVLEILGPCAQVEVLDQPDSASVIRQIPEYNIAHFACHGLSNWRTPLDSGLILQSDTGASPDTDNSGDTETLRQDILSVEKLCMSNLTQGEIAYLSACSTAQNTAVSVMDEMLHVVSGFQVAGFRHVIGTLWPSSDEVCAVVARSFYTELCRSGTVQYTDRDIALALNKASSALATSPDFQRRPLHWAPYIHYGA
ncbi:hypothetical protein LT330_000764 [Penicillium expansum]|nr:hypothetical protein LT330_000764 [Penicillium expansum]